MSLPDTESLPAPAVLRADAPEPRRNLVVVGASAGGLAALRRLVASLPADFGGTLLIATHLSPGTESGLAELLDRAGPLPVRAARDGEPIVAGSIRVAVPDCHLLVEPHRLRVVRGPKENRHRPAIDPLFRSAAWAFGPRVVGVVLTGYLDDGAAGLWAIKTCGGVSVVQDPTDAQVPDMPRNAMAMSEADHCLPLDDIAPLLARLAREPAPPPPDPGAADALKTEIDFARLQRGVADIAALGRPTPFTCPACRGSLWELHEGDRLRYRCHTGHALSSDSLLAEQGSAVEEGLFTALRAVHEKAAMLRRLAARWADRHSSTSADYEQRAAALDASADVLRELLAGAAR